MYIIAIILNNMQRKTEKIVSAGTPDYFCRLSLPALSIFKSQPSCFRAFSFFSVIISLVLSGASLRICGVYIFPTWVQSLLIYLVAIA
jgi:hypothetical protein